MQKIMVWGGTHPDELGPMLLADSLVRDPIPNVSSGIVNNIARLLGKRLDTINMNAAYPGDLDSMLAEERRAHHVLASSKGSDIVLDMHAMNAEDSEPYACISTKGSSEEVFGFLAGLGIKHLVSTDHNQLIEHVPHGVLLDLAPRQYRELDVLRGALYHIANSSVLETASPSDFNWYSFVPEGAHVSQFDPANLSYRPRPFEPVPEEVAIHLCDDPRSLYWLGILDEPNREGYWAELGKPIDPPDNAYRSQAA